MENNLPEGWATVFFTDVLDIQGGTQPPKSTFKYEPVKGYIRLLQIRDFGEKPLPTYIPFREQLKTCSENDILIARYGASIGRIVTGMTGAYNVALAKVIIPGSLDRDYVRYILKSDYFQRPILAIERSAQDGFNKDDLAEIEIPIPPVPEQHRIVAKLDALMERVERNKQRIDKIPALLKRFRQSVLAAAVNGRLTEEWRQANSKPEWEYDEAESLCHLITKGTTPKSDDLLSEGDIPFLKVYNIVNQKIDFNYKPQWVANHIHNNHLKRSRVYPNDVIMNIVGPPLGKVATVTNQYKEWNVNQALAIFRPKERLLPQFIFMILCEGTPISGIEKEFRGTAGQSNISLEQCRKFIFPIPSIAEQQEIARRVEQLFSFADKIEARYTKAKAMLDKLPQSILAKAFRGELIPQDPNDEPASVLLERIKAEKDEISKSKGKR